MVAHQKVCCPHDRMVRPCGAGQMGGCIVGQAAGRLAADAAQPEERTALWVTCWREVDELTHAECPEEVAIFPSNVMAYLKTPRGLPVTARCSNACSTKPHRIAACRRRNLSDSMSGYYQ